MELEELIEQLDALIIDAEDAQIGAIRAHQNRVLSALIKEVNGIATRKDGTIKPGRANRKRLRSIKKKLDGIVFDETYLNSTKRFQAALTEIEQLNAAWFKQEFTSFKRFITTDIAEEARLRASEILASNSLNVGLKQPISDVLDSYLSGGSINDLKQTFRDRVTTQFKELDGVVTTDQLGYLESNANRYVRDSLNQFSGSLNEAVGNSAGLEWIHYVGNKIRDTRQFCSERAGNYYHIDEVRSWAGLSWQGKNKSTTASNILTVRGGYNCRHQLIFVTQRRVPKSDIDRAIRLGFFE